MSHGIVGKRSFVYGLAGQGKDWHGKTIEKEKLTKELFPLYTPCNLFASGEEIGLKGQLKSGFQILLDEQGLPVGIPFDPDTAKRIQPREGWEKVMAGLEGTGFTVERMGNLWDGDVWFVSVDLTELNKITRKGEKFYLNFSSGLDGTMAFEGELTSTRIVCNNTLNISRSNGQKLFKIKQTMNSGKRVDAVKAEIEKAVGMAEIFNQTMKSLETTPATIEQARLVYAGELARNKAKFEKTPLKTKVDLGNGTFRYEQSTTEFREIRALNTVDALLGKFQRGDGNKGTTRADVLNGYTEFFTRGGDDDSKKDVWTALESSEFGLNADRKAEFYNMLSRPEKVEGKKRTPSGWDELITLGKKALETAGAL